MVNCGVSPWGTDWIKYYLDELRLHTVNSATQLFLKVSNYEAPQSCSFLQPPVTVFLLDPNILSSFLSLCYSVMVRDQVLHPRKGTRKIIILIFL
jgi:hypothetical protein